jgi:hypothetical protein
MMKFAGYLFNVSTKYEAWDRALQILGADPATYQKLITRPADIGQWGVVFDDLEQRKKLKAIFTVAA